MADATGARPGRRLPAKAETWGTAAYGVQAIVAFAVEAPESIAEFEQYGLPFDNRAGMAPVPLQLGICGVSVQVENPVLEVIAQVSPDVSEIRPLGRCNITLQAADPNENETVPPGQL